MPESPRMIFENQGGMVTVKAPDLLNPFEYVYLQNVRKLLGGRMTARYPLGANLLASALASGITSLIRLNDPYNTAGYAYVLGAAGAMYVNVLEVASGLSGNPLSFLAYRPSATPKPFCYVADPSLSVSILNPSYASYGPVSGMLKTDSLGNCYKSGIKEPQSAPVVTVASGTGPKWVSYRYVYRAAPVGGASALPVATGAQSNPSPESAPQIVPQSTSFGSQPAATGSTVNPNVTYNQTQYEGNSNQIRTKGGVAPGTLTDYIIITNFTLSSVIPSNVTIDGVQIAVNWQGQYAGTGIIANAALFYQGTILGQPKSPGLENSQTATTATQGGSSDTWGAVITPTIASDPTFGFGIQILTQESGGSDRSFINSFTLTIYYTTLNNTGICAPSTDPQVNTIDVYRQTPGLSNFTYVLSVPNSSPSFKDTLTDLQIANNPILQFDNYEPFPSVDLPRSGTCNVTAVSQGVSNISIISSGTGQTNGTFIINGVGGGGSGAQVQIVISGGIITSASVVNAGSGYTSAPSFPVSEGGTPGTLAASISPILPLTPNVTSVSGDPFNVRWLPGTIILIQNPGTNSSTAYLLYNRPTDSTHLTAYTTVTSDTGFVSFGFPPAGTNLTWSIAEPDLAAQPSPVIWGPTPDNAGSFYFGLDPLNPGDLVWSKGNNFDSAPDTNRLSVTSPSEPLMNGTVTSELSTVFSTERFWLIYPNFSDAVAAATGTLGQQWTLVQSAAKRGLYMRYAIGALGSLIAWRAKDGIFLSQGGGPEQEISGPIYNLFPHGEQAAPSPVVIGSTTVYPPDDTKPNAQTITVAPGYIFYDYQDTNGNPRTLVYEIESKGWEVDVTSPVANCHSLPVGVNQILIGGVDGTVRTFDAAGTETGVAIVSTGCQNGGNPRTVKRIGGVFLRALAASAITPQFWANRYGTQITGVLPATMGIAANEADYFADFTAANGADVLDLAAVFSFPLGSGNWLKEWQIDWTEIPASIVAWRTGMLAYGLDGWLHIPWIRFAYQSTTQVNLTITTDQGATVTLAIPPSSTPAKYFTWLPAVSGGLSMKFRLMEWTADAGGAPWTVFAAEIEMAIKEWGSTGPYKVIRPFRAVSQIPESTT